METEREKNVRECLEFCLSLSDDPNFQKQMKNSSHEERVLFLLDSGFAFYDLPEDEAKILEEMYREKARKQV